MKDCLEKMCNDDYVLIIVSSNKDSYENTSALVVSWTQIALIMCVQKIILSEFEVGTR